MILQSEFILYVSDQRASRMFYSVLLGIEPSLDVPGMTEFQLSDNVKLGLMPEEGIKKIIQEKLPDTSLGNGIPRCELYLKVRDIKKYIERAIQLKANEVNQLADRDWGDRVVYFADQDGHVIAFAETIE